MADREPADQLYRKLLSMHEAAFQAGRFELAYHLLAAAVHAAEELRNLELLSEVARVAEVRQQALDGLRPEHRLSSTSAQRRGNPAQYAALSAIAALVKGRITAQQALERSHRATRGSSTLSK